MKHNLSAISGVYLFQTHTTFKCILLLYDVDVISKNRIYKKKYHLSIDCQVIDFLFVNKSAADQSVNDRESEFCKFPKFANLLNSIEF